MTQKLDALRELLAKVEAGTDAPFVSMNGEQLGHFTQSEINWVQSANAGSLDAAKALHEAVLPGWEIDHFMLAGEVAIRRPRPLEREYGYADMEPARAWLACILKALIAEASHD